MFTRSQSTFKQGDKAAMEATKCSTFAGTGQSVFHSRQHPQQPIRSSRTNKGYLKARAMIDDLIALVQEKRQASECAYRAVGDTNDQALDSYREQSTQRSNWEQLSQENTHDYAQPTVQAYQLVQQYNNTEAKLLAQLEYLRYENYILRSRASQINARSY